MQHVEPPKDVSGLVAFPSGSARRSASVALLEYDDEVRVGLAHVLSQAFPLCAPGEGQEEEAGENERKRA